MQENELERLVRDVVAETIAQLEREDRLKNNEKSNYERTESLLRHFGELKKSNNARAAHAAFVVRNTMEALKKEPYAGVLKAFYMDGKTNAQCAADESCDERTARRKRKKMVEAIAQELQAAGLLRERWPWE